jgi:hypothetical protein
VWHRWAHLPQYLTSHNAQMPPITDSQLALQPLSTLSLAAKISTPQLASTGYHHPIPCGSTQRASPPPSPSTNFNSHASCESLHAPGGQSVG